MDKDNHCIQSAVTPHLSWYSLREKKHNSGLLSQNREEWNVPVMFQLSRHWFLSVMMVPAYFVWMPGVEGVARGWEGGRARTENRVLGLLAVPYKLQYHKQTPGGARDFKLLTNKPANLSDWKITCTTGKTHPQKSSESLPSLTRAGIPLYTTSHKD